MHFTSDSCNTSGETVWEIPCLIRHINCCGCSVKSAQITVDTLVKSVNLSVVDTLLNLSNYQLWIHCYICEINSCGYTVKSLNTIVLIHCEIPEYNCIDTLWNLWIQLHGYTVKSQYNCMDTLWNLWIQLHGYTVKSLNTIVWIHCEISQYNCMDTLSANAKEKKKKEKRIHCEISQYNCMDTLWNLWIQLHGYTVKSASTVAMPHYDLSHFLKWIHYLIYHIY
jgi:hypothetical protein